MTIDVLSWWAALDVCRPILQWHRNRGCHCCCPTGDSPSQYPSSLIQLIPFQYIAELAPPSIRGSLVGIYEINNQLSSLMGYWCNYIVNEYIPSTSSRQWQIPLAVQIVPSALLILAAIFILPESPRLLVKKGNKLQARKNLAWVRKLDPDHELVNREMQEIEDAIRMQNTPPPSVVHRHSGGKLGLFKELCWKGNRERVLIALGLMFGQNLTGIQGGMVTSDLLLCLF
jgi:MFS family permease